MQSNPNTRQAYKLLHDGVLALARAERHGLRVDMEYVERKKILLTKKIERLERKFKETDLFKQWQQAAKGTVNINSDSQLRYFLYVVKKIKPPKFTTTGQGATDEDALLQLDIPELNMLLERSKLKRLRDVNLEGYSREQVGGIIHPFFNLNLARTFRSSSDHPNFQNIPIRDEESMQICRGALYPRPGHQLLELDYKGIEVAVNACINKDPTLVKYVSDSKSDMHGDMAKQIFMIDPFDKSIPSNQVLRQAAKNGFVFPEFYGDYYKNCASNMACNWGKLPQGKWSTSQGISLDEGSFTLGAQLISKGVGSLTAFENHLKKIETDFWGNRFLEYARWKDRWYNAYKKTGYFDTPTGFRCSGVMSKNDVTNYPAQGSAFHCNLWSFIQLDHVMQTVKWDTRLVGQIHDSIILDVNPDELIEVISTAQHFLTNELPEAWPWIIVPLSVDMMLSPVDCSWAEKEEYKVN